MKLEDVRTVIGSLGETMSAVRHLKLPRDEHLPWDQLDSDIARAAAAATGKEMRDAIAAILQDHLAEFDRYSLHLEPLAKALDMLRNRSA
jgi:hypothetical protein